MVNSGAAAMRNRTWPHRHPPSAGKLDGFMA